MASGTETTIVETAGGRQLCVESGGDRGGTMVLVHGGTPSSRQLAGDALEDAAARGIHLVGYDRPGYGGSTSHPGRRVADCAGDVQAIADAFGATRIAVWGWSGGGPHALACGALLPGLVGAVATLGSPAPYGAPGLDYLAGMGEFNVEGFLAVLDDPEAGRKRLAAERRLMLDSTPEQPRDALSSLLSPADAAWFTDDRMEEATAQMKEGLAPGDAGYWEDTQAQFLPWGFAVEDVHVPVQLWHGAHDRMVPVQHGRWLAEHLPDVEAHMSDADGHLTLFDHVPAIHDWLLRHL